MNRVGEFEKVSVEQYIESIKDVFSDRSEEEIETLAGVILECLELPTRATSGSAGYDFKAPYGFALAPGQSIKIPTGIRVKIDDGWWLACLPKSGLGFKYRVQLDNTVGVIDSDYYNSDNEGHIFFKITNDNREDKALVIHPNDAFAQGVFLEYGVTHSDNADGVRNGGFGSTART